MGRQPRLLKLIVIISVCCFLSVFGPVVYAGASVIDFSADQLPYSIQNYKINVVLESDGSAMFEEIIEYQITEDLRDFSYQLDYPEKGHISLDKIIVTELTEGIETGFQIEALPGADNDSVVRPMTYHLQEEEEHLAIKLHVFSKADTERRVRLSYRVSDLLLLHEEACVLDYRFFNSGVRGDIADPMLSVQFPQQIPSSQIWSLATSQSDFFQETDQDTIRWQTKELRDREQLWLIVLTQPGLFPDALKVEETLTWSELTTRARELAEEEKEVTRWRQRAYDMIFVLLLLAVPLGFIIYWLFDHEATPEYQKKYSQDVPMFMPPALLSVFLRRRKPGLLILATLFDLVRRGELERDGYIFIRNDTAFEPYLGYKSYEIFLITWLFDHVAEGRQRISISDIRKYARDSGKLSDFRIYFQQFISLVKESLDEYRLYDHKKTQQGRFLLIVLSGAYAGLAVLLLIFLQTVTALLLFVPALAFLIYSFILRHLNLDGSELYARGQAVRRAIKSADKAGIDFDAAYYALALPLSIALGHSERLISQLSERMKMNLMDASIEHELAIYNVALKPHQWQHQLDRLKDELQVMQSLINSSILFAGGLSD